MLPNRRNTLAVIGIVLVGAVLGGVATFSYMDQRVDSLSQDVEELKDQRNVVHINSSRAGDSLVSLFDEVDQSVVSIQAFGSENGQGSGFIYNEEGYIVTNEHVISEASRIEVNFLDGSSRNAEVVGTDPYTDLAVLKVDKKGLEPLDMGDSSDARVGQKAVAIGNPFGLRSSMTSGIISQKGRRLPTVEGFSTPNVLQTDAAINPGNSGGPLMNLKGEIIGVNTAIESRTGVFNGIGFAIPVNTVKEVVPSIIEEGRFRHSWIGVSGVNVNPEIAEEMGLENTTGFLIVDVIEDGPAGEAGIKSGNRTVVVNGRELTVGGDVIVGINDEDIRGINDILLYLARETEVDQRVNVTVIRDGERKKIPMTLGARAERDALQE